MTIMNLTLKLKKFFQKHNAQGYLTVTKYWYIFIYELKLLYLCIYQL